MEWKEIWALYHIVILFSGLFLLVGIYQYVWYVLFALIFIIHTAITRVACDYIVSRRATDTNWSRSLRLSSALFAWGMVNAAEELSSRVLETNYTHFWSVVYALIILNHAYRAAQYNCIMVGIAALQWRNQMRWGQHYHMIIEAIGGFVRYYRFYWLWISFILTLDPGVFRWLVLVTFTVLKFVQVYGRLRSVTRWFLQTVFGCGFHQVADLTVLTDPNHVCSICRDSFTTPVKLICGHVFDRTCVQSWLSVHRTCPTCRKDVTEALKLDHGLIFF